MRAPLVLALPRGGVPVAAEVAQALDAPLDLLLVRKIGAPAQPELAVAAVAALADSALPSQTVLDPGLMLASDADQTYVEHGVSRERLELERRRLCYLRGRKALPMAGHTVIVVDDGVATGTTARAALKALRALPPEQAPDAVVLAVPVAPDQALQALAREVDAVVCLWAPAPFFAVGAHYRSFPQVSDEQVLQALNPEPGA